MSAGMSNREMLESLTGYEEQAIQKHFGADALSLSETMPTFLTRSLVFVEQTRKGLDAVKAKEVSMNLSIKEVNDYFGGDEDEVFEDEPETESGKDDLPAA